MKISSSYRASRWDLESFVGMDSPKTYILGKLTRPLMNQLADILFNDQDVTKYFTIGRPTITQRMDDDHLGYLYDVSLEITPVVSKRNTVWEAPDLPFKIAIFPKAGFWRRLQYLFTGK